MLNTARPITAARPITEARDLSSACGLPALSRAFAAALSNLYCRSAPVQLSIRGREFFLRWRWTVRSESEYSSYTLLRFRLGSHGGWLGIDQPLLAWLVGERRSDLLPTDLRYVLVADALGTLADRLEQQLRLHFEWSTETGVTLQRIDPQRCVQFELLAKANGERMTGVLQFDEPDRFAEVLERCDLPVRQDRGLELDGLKLAVSFELGHSQIPLRELQRVGTADIIRVEHWSHAGGGLRLTSLIGGGRGLRLVGFVERSQITIEQANIEQSENPTMTEQGTPNAHDSGAPQTALDRIDALEMPVRFEIGDLSLSLGELRKVRGGHVFELDAPLNRSTVRILVHGNVLGKGHLVTVGDSLGVRVVEFATSDLERSE